MGNKDQWDVKILTLFLKKCLILTSLVQISRKVADYMLNQTNILVI